MSSRKAGIKGRAFLAFVHGHVLMRYLRIRHHSFLQQAAPLAILLETKIFPALKQENVKCFDLCVIKRDRKPVLVARTGAEELRLDECERLASALERIGVRGVRLDTKLEYGQIVEALLLLLRVHSHLHRATPMDSAYSGWGRELTAARMLGPVGYHKFGALLRYDLENECYEVEYSYCELMLSRAVRNYAEGKSLHGGHRSLFKAAPFIAAAVWVVLMSPVILLQWSPATAGIAWIIAAIACATGFGVLTWVLGAFLYTQEHLDLLTKKYLDQIQTLSRFPEADPNPVVELTLEGKPVYVNPAAKRLISELGSDQTDVASILPEDIRSLIKTSMADEDSLVSVEVTRNGHTINYTACSFPGAKSIILAGRDVTEMKLVEEELRELNQRVSAKNRELKSAYDIVDRELDDADRELAIVADIQHSLLPAKIPDMPNLDVAAYYDTSWNAGGDYYDFFPLRDGRWGLLIADVSGHGTPAAVMMAISHSIAHLFHDERTPTVPSELLSFTNSVLNRHYTHESRTFVTAFYCIYDPANRTLAYSSAGHPPPRLKRLEDDTISGLQSEGSFPLGIDPQAAYEDHVVELKHGDCIILYTDGITETTNDSRNMFGTEGLDAIALESEGTASDIIQKLLAAVLEFAGETPVKDDQTVVVVRTLFEGQEESSEHGDMKYD